MAAEKRSGPETVKTETRIPKSTKRLFRSFARKNKTTEAQILRDYIQSLVYPGKKAKK